MKINISFLLSTFNSSGYLAEQMDSLLYQKYNCFVIWVRVDGSTDFTKEIVERYKRIYPERFSLNDVLDR
jgi:glycosyltransferase involved in cell wall biosynthesis